MQNFKGRISLFIIAILLASPGMLFAQAPKIEWQKCFGGIYNEGFSSITQTSDGGFVSVGVKETYTDLEAWIIKLNKSGSIQWQRALPGVIGGDEFYSVTRTYDKGCIVAGQGFTPCQKSSEDHGGRDFWVIKIDSNGSNEWENCFGGIDYDYAFSVFQTSDSEYVAAGSTVSQSGDVSGYIGQKDYSEDGWIIGINSQGNLKWQKCLAAYSHYWYPFTTTQSIIQTSDGGFAVAGYAWNMDQAYPQPNALPSDAYIGKLDSSRNIVWWTYIGGSKNDIARSIVQTSNGELIIAGYTESNDKDVAGNHGGRDAWVVKLNDSGKVIWQKCLGGSGKDQANSIISLSNGNLLVAGQTNSTDGDVSSNHGNDDAWLIELDSLGNIQWQKCYGGSSDDVATSLVQTFDGGYIFSGTTYSNDGDVSGKHGDMYSTDGWIVKLNFPSYVQEQSTLSQTLSLSTFPNPATNIITLAYDLSKPSSVEISIYSVTGERMKEIQEASVENGHHEAALDLSGFPDGTYFISVSACGVTERQMVQLIK